LRRFADEAGRAGGPIGVKMFKIKIATLNLSEHHKVSLFIELLQPTPEFPFISKYGRQPPSVLWKLHYNLFMSASVSVFSIILAVCIAHKFLPQ